MSDRVEPYYRQNVTEDEVEQWHDQLEAADRNIVEDTDLWGIQDDFPFVVTENGVPDFLVKVIDGRAYEEDGKRLAHSGTTLVDCAVDFVAAPTAVLNPGNENGLSIYVKFVRVASDPRVDGDGNPLNYLQEEGVEFEVRQSGEAAAPATYPGTVGGQIKIAEITLTFGLAAILNANISTANGQFGGPRRYKTDTLCVPHVFVPCAGQSSTTAGVSDFESVPASSVGTVGRSNVAHGTASMMRYGLTRLQGGGIITRVRVKGTQDGPDPGGGGDVVVTLYEAVDGAGVFPAGGPWATGLGAPGGAFTIDQVVAVPIDNLKEYWIEVECANLVGAVGDVILSARAWHTARIILPG